MSSLRTQISRWAPTPAVRGWRLWCKGALIVLLSLLWLSFTRHAYAQTVTIGGSITADNNYELCYGNAAAVTACIGTDNAWGNAESFMFPPLNATSDYIYIAGWSDDWVAQGLLFEFSAGATTIYSGDPVVEVKPTGQNLDAFDPAPGPAGINPFLPGAWAPTFVGGNNGMSPWGTIPGINASARWIWFDSGNDPSPWAPLTNGFNHDEFLIFRIPVKAFVPCKQLCGIKFHDANGNGVQDPGEPALPGWQIVLVDQNGNVQIVTTDANGQYTFAGLAPGNYTLYEIAQPGWVQTAPASGSHQVMIQQGQVITGLNFGNRPCKPHHEEQPDLTIKKVAQVDRFEVGQTVEYLLTVQNIGAGAANGPITITDYLPNGLTPTSSSWSVGGWTCSVSGQLVTCTHPGPLPPGYSATIPVKVLVGPEAVPVVENCAKIDVVNDLDYNNNVSCVSTAVTTPKLPDLTIKKWAEPQSFTTGSTAYYMVSVTNVGVGPTVGNSVMYDSLPAGVTPINVTVDPAPNNWNCLISGQDVQCELTDPIAPGQTYTFKIEVKVTDAALPGVQNCAVTKSRLESDTTNNEACVETAVEPGIAADLGDAPDSSNHNGMMMRTYPTNVTAKFPTVYDPATGAPSGPIHWAPKQQAWLGRDVSGEKDADLLPDADGVTNIEPPTNLADRDRFDDGLVLTTANLPTCGRTRFQYQVTVVGPTMPLYLNGWFDYNRDGDWADVFTCTDAAGVVQTVREWSVRDQVMNLAPGVYTRWTPYFYSLNGASTNRPMWMRLSLSEGKAELIPPAPPSTKADGRGPAAGFRYGETEDYYLGGVTTPLPTAASVSGASEDTYVEITTIDEGKAPETQDAGEDVEQIRMIYLPSMSK